MIQRPKNAKISLTAEIIKNNTIRKQIIKKDDITNLVIKLNTTKTIQEFLNSI